MANHGADIALTGEADGSADKPVFFVCAIARILQRVFDTLAAHHGAYAGDHSHGVFRITATRAIAYIKIVDPFTTRLLMVQIRIGRCVGTPGIVDQNNHADVIQYGDTRRYFVECGLRQVFGFLQLVGGAD